MALFFVVLYIERITQCVCLNAGERMVGHEHVEYKAISFSSPNAFISRQNTKKKQSKTF